MKYRTLLADLKRARAFSQSARFSLIVVATVANSQEAQILPEAPINPTADECAALSKSFYPLQKAAWDRYSSCVAQAMLNHGTYGICAGVPSNCRVGGSTWTDCCATGVQACGVDSEEGRQWNLCMSRVNSALSGPENHDAASNLSREADWHDAGGHRETRDRLSGPVASSGSGVAERKTLFTEDEANALRKIMKNDKLMIELKGSNYFFSKLSERLAEWAGPATGTLDFMFQITDADIEAAQKIIKKIGPIKDDVNCQILSEPFIENSPNADFFDKMRLLLGCRQ